MSLVDDLRSELQETLKSQHQVTLHLMKVEGLLSQLALTCEALGLLNAQMEVEMMMSSRVSGTAYKHIESVAEVLGIMVKRLNKLTDL